MLKPWVSRVQSLQPWGLYYPICGKQKGTAIGQGSSWPQQAVSHVLPSVTVNLQEQLGVTALPARSHGWHTCAQSSGYSITAIWSHVH